MCRKHYYVVRPTENEHLAWHHSPKLVEALKFVPLHACYDLYPKPRRRPDGFWGGRFILCDPEMYADLIDKIKGEQRRCLGDGTKGRAFFFQAMQLKEEGGRTKKWRPTAEGRRSLLIF